MCKAGVEVDKVVPIYGRGSDTPADPRADALKLQPLPPRPAGQRTAAVQVGGDLCCLHVQPCPRVPVCGPAA